MKQKCLVLCLVFLSLMTAYAPFAAAETFLPGDINENGKIDREDAILLLEHLVGRSELTNGALERADANQDGIVDVADLVWIGLNSVPQDITIMLPGNVPLVLVHIPAGSFQMGSPDTERGRSIEEGPVHTVNIGYDFYMGKYEVTQKQWLAVMVSWPRTPTSFYGVGDNYPAYYISWDDAKNFITALNTHISNTGQGPLTVRLPSEAEWEYACRAGTQTRFFFGDSLDCGDDAQDCAAGTLPGNRSDYMWYWGNNSPSGSKPVGTKLPNQFGLFDMHGNVWEWCEDDWHSSYNGAPVNGSAWVDNPRASLRVVRGGYWCTYARICRSASRHIIYPMDRHDRGGFRLSAVRH